MVQDLPDNGDGLAEAARRVLSAAKARGWTLATAESCTGGLVASLLTDIPGFSACFDRGFVTYSEAAKCDLLGITPIELARHGAVSEEVARHMAQGALDRSGADAALAITGFAGPGGPRDEPGLVYLAVRGRAGQAMLRECRFGERSRAETRCLAAEAGLALLEAVLTAR